MRCSDAAVFVDQVGNPLRVLIAWRGRRTVGDADLAIGIAEQRERKFVFLRESGVVLRLVEAGAEDLDVLRLVVAVEVPEPGTLGGSPGCISLREEPKQHFFSAEVPKL